MPHPLDDAFAHFLRADRARMTVDPREGTSPRRRVPGLRRQEFAELAGLNVEYYTKLEQGRALNPSMSVLNAIADASDLDRATRSYLYRIAMQEDAHTRLDPITIPAELHQPIGSLDNTLPAFVLTPWTDVVASNAPGRRAFGVADDGGVVNVTRRLFLEPDAATLYGDGEDVAREQVGAATVPLNGRTGTTVQIRSRARFHVNGKTLDVTTTPVSGVQLATTRASCSNR